MPDFIYVGADKCGSSWLFEILRQHPDIFLPYAKDLYFFDREYLRGISWYEAYFREAQITQKTGEISHDYMYDFKALRRIRKHYPSTKIIISLRHPVERLWSAYLFLLRHGYEFSSLQSAIEWDNTLKTHSEYIEGVRKCFELFGRDNVHVMFLEDVKAEPEAEIRKLLEFINVDPQRLVWPTNEVFLKAARPRLRSVARIAKLSASALRSCGANNLLGRLKRNSVIQRALYKPYDGDPPTMKEEMRVKLENDLLDRNKGLAKLIGRKLPWE